MSYLTNKSSSKNARKATAVVAGIEPVGTATGSYRVSHNPPWKSETKNVAIGQPLEFSEFVPQKGPSGRRVVVDRFIICVAGVITVATADWNGKDVPRILGNVAVEDTAGKQRWNLSGLKSRMASIFFNGIEEHSDHATIAQAAGAAVDLRLIIPMTKQKVTRGKDFALPADLFRKVSLNINSYAGAASGTTVLSAATLTCYVLAEWHEEHNVEFKAEDVVKSTDFNSSTQCKLTLGGAVHDLFVVKEGTTAGGDAITTLTDARIEDLGTPTLTRLDLVSMYRRKRGLGASGPTTPATERFLEPVLEGKALPVVTADMETSLWDGRVLDTMKLDVGTGLTGLSAITREITPKSQANYQAQVARFKIDPKGIRMKTDGKTKRNFGDGWTDHQKMVGVWSAPMRRTA